MDNDVFIAVQHLIGERTGVPAEKIRPDTRLAEDLGIDGDDAWELMKEYADRFQVDMSSMRFSYHFGSEGIPVGCGLLMVGTGLVVGQTVNMTPWAIPLWIAAGLLGLRKVLKQSERSGPGTLQTRDLVQFAETKKWTFPYPENKKG